MVTLRAYLNPTDVLVAKAHLNDHAIECAVADEFAHMYGGAPFAMPIRLLVREEDLPAAARVLDQLNIVAGAESTQTGDVGEPALDVLPEDTSLERDLVPRPRATALPGPNNPWEILIVALLFLVPGVALFLNNRALVLLPPRNQGRLLPTILSPLMSHFLALVPLGIAAALVVLYFRTRKAIRQDQRAEGDTQ